MDSELAFCLERFIDDQVQIIDDRIDELKKEENDKCEKFEKDRNNYEKKRPPSKNKGSHQEDKNLVDQFIEDLHRNSQTNTTRTIIDNPSCIDTLRAEISTKRNACAGYLSQLRSVAKPLPNTRNFVGLCNETIDYFQRTQQFEENFRYLFIVLEQSDSSNVIRDVQKWWKDTYGDKIMEINSRNNNINKALTENNFAVISQTSRIIQNAKKLIDARTVIVVEPPKNDIIRKFVRRLLTLDEEQREKTNPDELIHQLINLDIDEVINYANRWLIKRDEIRNQKEEENPCM